MFNYKSLDFSSLMGNSATNTIAISKISRNPVYSLYTGNYGDITFLDYFGEFLEVKDENARTFNWKIQPYSTPENDALHWDEETTKKAMKVIFDLANL